MVLLLLSLASARARVEIIRIEIQLTKVGIFCVNKTWGTTIKTPQHSSMHACVQKRLHNFFRIYPFENNIHPDNDLTINKM